ncbi:MAG TPA: helix-turn-helix domain-containing protein [Candidatus Borkfalkia stercoripullorum]|nr:helix-turn-helix domain-containing protein [Candidatus Borkfalkia stercoripullorum]
MEAIGEIIRKNRKARGLTQLALATRLGVTPQAVGKWERGESEPDLSLLLPLAKELNVTAETLFGAEQKQGFVQAEFLAEKLSESLKCRRLCANLTQAELAEKVGVRPQTISKWENGVCAPDIGYCAALCELYGVSPTQLLSERAYPPLREPPPESSAPARTAAAERAKKPNPFARRPIRAAALALIFALALCIVFIPFAAGTGAPSLSLPDTGTDNGSTQLPEEPGAPEDPTGPGDTDEPEGPTGPGGTDEPEGPTDPGDTDEPEDPTDPGTPPAGTLTYHTLTVYSEIAEFPEERTVWTDERVGEGWQLVYGPDAQAENGVLALFYGHEGYIVTDYTYEDGTAAEFPLTMTDDVTLYMHTEPRWLDWASRDSYAEQKTLQLFNTELECAYANLETYMQFCEEFAKLSALYPETPRKELFLYLNDPGRLPAFPHTETIFVDGEEISLPQGNIPCSDNYPYLTVWEMQPDRAAAFEAFCNEHIRIPTLYLTYALTRDDVPLEAAFTEAMSYFGPFTALGHESVTKSYRDFMRRHAQAEPYDFPVFEVQ